MFEINSDSPSALCTRCIRNAADRISSAAPTQVKELTFTHGIAAHDLTVKVKQIESWLEKNNHIRVTLRAKRGQPADNLVRTLPIREREHHTTTNTSQLQYTVGLVGEIKGKLWVFFTVPQF